MPQKNLYIREDDVLIFEMATEIFEDKGLGAVMADHFRTIIPQIKDEIFKLLLVEKNASSFMSLLIERRLRDFPDKVVYEMKRLIEALLDCYPDYFKNEEFHRNQIELIDGEDWSYVEKTKKIAKKCLKKRV